MSLTVDGETVRIGATKGRAVLAALALRAGRPLRVVDLSAALWDESPPASADKAIQTYVWGLRRIVPREAIETVAAGYMLRIDPTSVDVHRFASLVAVGRRQIEVGQLDTAANAFTDAMDLWKGDLVSDFADGSWAASEFVRLQELRRECEDDLAGARLALGHHDHLVGELRSAVVAEPLRERRWANLMLGLYRSGRQAEALRAFQELRRVLGEQLGIEPSIELTALEEAIVLQKPELKWRKVDDSTRSNNEKTIGRRALSFPATPPALTELARRPLVGRTVERSLLLSEWRKAQSVGQRGVLIQGEPGVGKSRMLADLVETAVHDGAIVLVGRCYEGGTEPYQPFAEAIRAILEVAHSDPLLGILSSHAEPLRCLVPELESVLSSEHGPPSPIEESELFQAIRSLLQALSVHAAVLFIVDDMQWSYSSTTKMLCHLLSVGQPTRLLIVGAGCFDDESETPISPSEEFRRLPLVQTIRLGGLQRNEVAELVRHEGLNTQPIEPLIETLTRRTGGNPFFIEQLLRHLNEGGHSLPESLVGVVRARFDRLPLAAQRVLRVHSVIGPGTTLRLLRAIPEAGADLDQIVQGVDAAVRGGLTVETGHGDFVFSHDVFREALYAALGPASRIRLHQHVGQAIEATPDKMVRLDELAYHFSKAASIGETGKAIRYSILAAERAMERSANDHALRTIERLAAMAIGQLGFSEEELADIEIWLTRVRRATGDFDGAREAAFSAARHARAARSPTHLALAAINLTGGAVGADRDAASLCEEALNTLDRDEIGLRAQLLAFLAYHRAIDLHEGWAAEDMSGEALSLARQSRDVMAVGAALFAAIWVLAGSSRTAERLALADELLDLDSPSDHPLKRAGWGGPVGWRPANQLRHGLRARAVIRLQMGDRRGFDADVLRMQTDPRLYAPEDLAYAALLTGTSAHLNGNLTLAEEKVQEVITLMPADPTYRASALCMLWYVRREQSRLAEVMPHLNRAADELPQYPTLLAMRALSLADLGDHVGSSSLINALAADDFGCLPRDFTWPASLAVLAESCALVAATTLDMGPVERLHAHLLPYASQTVVFPRGMLCTGSVDRYLGILETLLSRRQDAELHFRSAHDLEVAMEAPALQARTLTWHQGFFAEFR